MTVTAEDDGIKVLGVVLPDAVRRTSDAVASRKRRGVLTRSAVRDAWVRGLRDAFASYYAPLSGPRRLAVFGGKPLAEEAYTARVPSGIPGWSRWEFLHDVSVVEWEVMGAAYAKHPTDPGQKRPVPVVTRALWQVESEIAANGTKVAEDASKLVVSAGVNKLLVTSFTGQDDALPWRDFLARTLSRADGNRFVALVPNYGSDRGYEQWQSGSVPLTLYRCCPVTHEAVEILVPRVPSGGEHTIDVQAGAG